MLARVVEGLSAKVAALEARAADVERQHTIVQAARASWKPQLVARNKLVLVSDAGDFAVVPLSLVRALHAGRPLDLDVEEHEGDVVLVDAAGGVVANMPRAAFMALPRVVATQELRRLLELEVSVPSASHSLKMGADGAKGPMTARNTCSGVSNETAERTVRRALSQLRETRRGMTRDERNS